MSTREPAATREQTGSWTFYVKHFRALASLDWSPNGVCLLGGPNGSGKTTILRALQFPRYLFNHDFAAALTAVDGATDLRDLGAPDDAPVTFELRSGEVSWRIDIPIEGFGFHPYYGECVKHGDTVVYDARPYESAARIHGKLQDRHERLSGLQLLWTSERPPWLSAFVARVTGVRTHHSYWLNEVRRASASRDAGDFLHPSGRNLWAVLNSWGASEDAPKRAQLEWVIDEARRAFPDIFAGLRFDGPNGEPRLYVPDHEDQGLGVHLAADGLLVGLMHLTAVAGATRDMILAFDEMENQLHPHAIRSLLAAMRARADAYALTIILTTHSPVLMNEFKGHEDAFFVIDRSVEGASEPTPLSRVRDPKWLRHFALGDLYDREEFGAPVVRAAPPSDSDP